MGHVGELEVGTEALCSPVHVLPTVVGSPLWNLAGQGGWTGLDGRCWEGTCVSVCLCMHISVCECVCIGLSLCVCVWVGECAFLCVSLCCCMSLCESM